MSAPTCSELRERLALGLSVAGGLYATHLAYCKGCREEAVRTERLLDAIAEDARIEPPPELDGRLRRLLLETPIPARLSRVSAAGLAVAAFLALFFTLAVALAEAGAAEDGLFQAFRIAMGYMAVSAAVTLPLLLKLHSQGHLTLTGREVPN